MTTNVNEKHDLVILYSGGADSRLLLEMALAENRKPYCLLINYEQLHKTELESAILQLSKLNINSQTVFIKGLNVNSGLTGDGIKNTSGEVHEMHMPSRNLMFMGIAASIAESKGINEIWIGCDYSDLINKFPDCMPGWINKTNEVLQINGPKPIQLKAPLLKMTKEIVVNTLKNLGINTDELFSGYGEL